MYFLSLIIIQKKLWVNPLNNTDHGYLQSLKEILVTGFSEDIGFGDLSTQSIQSNDILSGIFTAKSDGVLSGSDAIKLGYHHLDPSVDVKLHKKDGDRLAEGDQIAEVSGPVKTLLTGERVILNIVQHMSGIATATSKAVKAVEGGDIRICDTRKTLPGLRAIQKYAVRTGGGFNHRLRLDDGVMIKDNHIAAAGSISGAVEAARATVGLMVRVEVECETEEQVREAVEAGADIIMLDNKTPKEAAKLCQIIPDRIIVELSGGITHETAGLYKNCGAHYLSMGSVTHSVTAFDISFNLKGGIKQAAS